MFIISKLEPCVAKSKTESYLVEVTKDEMRLLRDSLGGASVGVFHDISGQLSRFYDYQNQISKVITRLESANEAIVHALKLARSVDMEGED